MFYQVIVVRCCFRNKYFVMLDKKRHLGILCDHNLWTCTKSNLDLTINSNRLLLNILVKLRNFVVVIRNGFKLDLKKLLPCLFSGNKPVHLSVKQRQAVSLILLITKEFTNNWILHKFSFHMLNFNSHHLQSPYQDEIQFFCSNFRREIQKGDIFASFRSHRTLLESSIEIWIKIKILNDWAVFLTRESNWIAYLTNFIFEIILR